MRAFAREEQRHLTAKVAELGRNDFEFAAFGEIAQLPHAARAMIDAGASIAMLSGSGGALFGVFDSAEVAELLGAIAEEVLREARLPAETIQQNRFGHLARRDDHDDDRNDLAVAVAVHAAEGDQREVARVEHQLDAEQHDERVAPREDAEGADRAREHAEDPSHGRLHSLLLLPLGHARAAAGVVQVRAVPVARGQGPARRARRL